MLIFLSSKKAKDSPHTKTQRAQRKAGNSEKKKNLATDLH